jgi:hypothetical protein
MNNTNKQPAAQDEATPAKAADTGAEKGVDRRRHPRVPESRPAWLQLGSNATPVEMIDISVGGACFISQRALQVGRAVRLQVGHGKTQVIIEGIVVRQLQRPDGAFEVGLKVDDLHGFEVSRRFPSRSRLTHS